MPQGRGRADHFPLPRFLAHFISKADEPFPNEVPCEGTFAWKRAGKNGPVDFRVFLQPSVFSFQVPRTEGEGEGVRLALTAEGKWFVEDRQVYLTLYQEVTGGSFSWSPWFFPFDSENVKSRFQGLIDGRQEISTVNGVLDLSYPPLGEIRVSVNWPFRSHPPKVAGKVEVKGLPLEKGFPLSIGKPLSYRHPILEKLFLRGLLDGWMVVSKEDQGFELSGRIGGRGLEMRWKDHNLAFRGVDLDLPLRYSSFKEKGEDRGWEETGRLSMGEVSTPWFILPAFAVPFSAGHGGYRFSEEVRLPLWGGEVALSSLEVGDLFQGIQVRGELSLNNVQLKEIFQKEGMEGSLSGTLGPIRLDPKKAEIPGIWQARVFDGTVEGKNFWIENPFSGERKIGGDLDFSGLNLEVITRLFSFGKITGYVGGRVRDLVLKGTMPERFRLTAYTQDRPGVRKRINVTAIENIGLLGTGWGEMDTLRKGINRFISEYAYREIGFTCSLRDDLFTLRGTIIEDGVEYLVRKPAFWGIDVINKNPDNEILFSDIIERLKRIGNRSKEGIRYEME